MKKRHEHSSPRFHNQCVTSFFSFQAIHSLHIPTGKRKMKKEKKKKSEERNVKTKTARAAQAAGHCHSHHLSIERR